MIALNFVGIAVCEIAIKDFCIIKDVAKTAFFSNLIFGGWSLQHFYIFVFELCILSSNLMQIATIFAASILFECLHMWHSHRRKV